jgi:hypothetical protein
MVELLKPVLDTYADSPVALVGCRSLGIERSCCEHDLVVVSKEMRPTNSVRVGDEYLDIFFRSEKETLNPSDPELAVSMAFASPVRDNALLLSSSCSAARAVLSENAKKSSQGRLASSLKAIGRTEEALSHERTADADFWLLMAAYDFASAWLYATETKPAPSHLLTQLKQHSQGYSGRFAAFAGAAGLEMASKSECEARLDSLGTLYDMIDAPHAEGTTGTGAGRMAFEIARKKAAFMNAESQPADCYSFLGCELVRVLPLVVERRQGESKAREQPLLVSQLSEGEGRVISESVVKGLGLVRSETSLRASLKALMEQVSELTRAA